MANNNKINNKPENTSVNNSAKTIDKAAEANKKNVEKNNAKLAKQKAKQDAKDKLNAAKLKAKQDADAKQEVDQKAKQVELNKQITELKSQQDEKDKLKAAKLKAKQDAKDKSNAEKLKAKQDKQEAKANQPTKPSTPVTAKLPTDQKPELDKNEINKNLIKQQKLDKKEATRKAKAAKDELKAKAKSDKKSVENQIKNSLDISAGNGKKNSPVKSEDVKAEAGHKKTEVENWKKNASNIIDSKEIKITNMKELENSNENIFENDGFIESDDFDVEEMSIKELESFEKLLKARIPVSIEGMSAKAEKLKLNIIKLSDNISKAISRRIKETEKENIKNIKLKNAEILNIKNEIKEDLTKDLKLIEKEHDVIENEIDVESDKEISELEKENQQKLNLIKEKSSDIQSRLKLNEISIMNNMAIQKENIEKFNTMKNELLADAEQLDMRRTKFISNKIHNYKYARLGKRDIAYKIKLYDRPNIDNKPEFIVESMGKNFGININKTFKTEKSAMKYISKIPASLDIYIYSTKEDILFYRLQKNNYTKTCIAEVYNKVIPKQEVIDKLSGFEFKLDVLKRITFSRKALKILWVLVIWQIVIAAISVVAFIAIGA